LFKGVEKLTRKYSEVRMERSPREVQGAAEESYMLLIHSDHLYSAPSSPALPTTARPEFHAEAPQTTAS